MYVALLLGNKVETLKELRDIIKVYIKQEVLNEY